MFYSSTKFTPVYGKFPTPAEELRIGDVFWHRVAIDPEDVADLTSETAKEYVSSTTLIVVFNPSNCNFSQREE